MNSECGTAYPQAIVEDCRIGGLKTRASVGRGGWYGMKLKKQIGARSLRMECMWKRVSALFQELPVSVLCSCVPFS